MICLHKCVSFILVLITLLLTKTTVGLIKNGQCVKVYYQDDDYFKIYCFNSNNSIATDRNDTVEYTETNGETDCFNVTTGSGKINKICTSVVENNCVLDNEKPAFWMNYTKESDAIKCKPSDDVKVFIGIETKCFVVLIEEMVFVPHHLIMIPNRFPDRE